MKQSIFILLSLAVLAACQKPEQPEEPVLLVQPNLAPPAASALTASAPAAPSSPIVAQILNTPQEADIITTSKDVMQNVSASDIAAASALAASQSQTPVETVFVPEDDLPNVKLPDACERYYKRVDACFAQQADNSEELRVMNQEARVDLAADKPTDRTCEALDQSFNAVARQLRCE